MKISSGILIARVNSNQFDDSFTVSAKVKKTPIEYLLAHPGGPFFENKDNGSWTIPKGLVEEGEDLKNAAFREFKEETNLSLDTGKVKMIPLDQAKLKSGKIIHGWGVCVDKSFDTKKFKSNMFKMEYPPKSGQHKSFPEIDKIEFFSFNEAKEKINTAQICFLDQLDRYILESQRHEYN